MLNAVKWILIVAGVLVLLLVLGFYWGEQYAERKLHEAVELRTEEGDTVSVHKVDISLLRGSIRFDSIQVNYTLHRDSGNDFHLRGFVPRVSATGVSFWQYLTKKRIQLGRLRMHEPELTLVTFQKPDSTRADTSGGAPPEIHLGQFDVLGGRVTWLQSRDGSLLLSADSFETSLYNIHYPLPAGRSLPFDDATWFVNQIHLPKADGLYDYYIDRIEGSINENSVRIGSFRQAPRYTFPEFVQKLQYKKGWLAFRLDDIHLEDALLKRFLHGGALHAERLRIGSAAVEAYEDLEMTRNPNEPRKLLIQEALREVPLPFTIDRITVPSANIKYGIRTKDEERGQITFQRAKATFNNVTNEDSTIRRRPNMVVDFESMFMKETSVSAHFTFNLGSTVNRFTMTGRLGSYPLPDINPMLIPAANVRIKTGQLHELTYEAVATEAVVRGTMELVYENLDVDMDDSYSFIQKILKGLVLKEKNLPGKDFREGVIYHEHDRTYSFFNLYWKAIVAGLQSSALANIALKKELKRRDREERRAEREAERQRKKAERERKKAERQEKKEEGEKTKN